MALVTDPVVLRLNCEIHKMINIKMNIEVVVAISFLVEYWIKSFMRISEKTSGL